jgi:hypothetical protein
MKLKLPKEDDMTPVAIPISTSIRNPDNCLYFPFYKEICSEECTKPCVSDNDTSEDKKQ